MATPNLILPRQSLALGQPHLSFNAAMRALDAVVQLSVISRSLSTPPGGPAEGDRYIVASSPTGAWTGQTAKIAAWLDGQWVFFTPREGWLAWVAAEDTLVAWTGAAWDHRLVGSVNGGSARLIASEEVLTLSAGSTVDAAAGAVIQDRDIVFGVAMRVIVAVTGVPSFGVGVNGNATQFGGTLNIALNSTNIGVIGPTAFYAPTPVRITATSGTFTGGQVRLILYAIRFTAPAS
jgi:hypothetical protein